MKYNTLMRNVGENAREVLPFRGYRVCNNARRHFKKVLKSPQSPGKKLCKISNLIAE